MTRADLLALTMFLTLLAVHVLTAGPRPCEVQGRAPVAVEELPAGFGKPTRLDDIRPGEWFWSETDQRVYLRLTGNRYADSTTGEVWSFTPGHGVGWPCRVEVKVVRPNSIDIRPWSYPERDR